MKTANINGEQAIEQAESEISDAELESVTGGASLLVATAVRAGSFSAFRLPNSVNLFGSLARLGSFSNKEWQE